MSGLMALSVRAHGRHTTLALLVASVSLAACSSAGRPDYEPVVFDPCQSPSVSTDPSASAAEAASVAAALADWNRAAGLALRSVAGTGDITVRFEDAAPMFFGQYEDSAGVIFVNHQLRPDSARTITIAHELGHAFGLVHVSGRRSLMNPGNRSVDITDRDVLDLRALWGPCPVTTPSSSE